MNYIHPAFTLGSNGGLYASIINNGIGSTVQNPTTDTAETYWKRVDAESLTGPLMAYLKKSNADDFYYRKEQVDKVIDDGTDSYLSATEVQAVIDSALQDATDFDQEVADMHFYQKIQVDNMIANRTAPFLSDTQIDIRINAARSSTGIILAAYPSNTIPNGWLLCDGRVVSRIAYTDLFVVIGTEFGNGNGSTTFNLPDYRGLMLVGRDSEAIGDTGGARDETLTTNQISSHQHGVSSHFHSVSSHSHGGGSHSHSTGSHSHSSIQHSHSFSVPAHTHSIPAHTHSYSGPLYGTSPDTGSGGTSSEFGDSSYSTSSSLGGNIGSGGLYSGVTESAGDGNTGDSGGGSTGNSSSSTGSSSSSVSSVSSESTGSVGNNVSHGNMPPYSVVNWLIKT